MRVLFKNLLLFNILLNSLECDIIYVNLRKPKGKSGELESTCKFSSLYFFMPALAYLMYVLFYFIALFQLIFKLFINYP